MIICRCITPHSDHQFTADDNGLCSRCAHNVSAHKAGVNELVEQLVRLVRAHPIRSVQMRQQSSDLLLLEVSLGVS